MKKFLLLSVAATLISSVLFAKIFRVGYLGPQIVGVDYATLQAAHDAAIAGDTLMFYPGNFNISVATKRLVYLGYGFNLSGEGGNPNLQKIVGSCNLDLYLNASASGSVFEGIDGLAVRSYRQENVNDVVIRRCRVSAGVFNTTGTTCNNWQISQCAYVGFSGAWTGGKATNFRIDNSLVGGLSFGGNMEHTGLFNNCYFEQGFELPLLQNVIMFQNCIFFNTSISNFASSIFQNCLFKNANPGLTGSNNQFNVAFTSGNVNTVFIGFPTVAPGESEDGRYKLKAGSPAIGAGIGGIDLGIYGGVNPYKLSGMPAIPAIYRFDAPSLNATTNPYTINFSIRSNN